MNEHNDSVIEDLNLELASLDLPKIEELEVSDSLAMPEAGASIAGNNSFCCSCCCC